MLQIREVAQSDFERIDELYDQARAFMFSYGNTTQWTNGFPNSSTLIPAMDKHQAFVCFDDEKDSKVVGVFVLADDEPVYTQDTVKWTIDAPYVVIHRLASEPGSGAGQFIFRHVMENYPYIRVDTGESNKPMLHLMDKLGFKYTGTVFYDRPGGGIRVAYDYVRP